MLDLLVVVSAVASLLSPWSISIPPAHLPQAFGYETPACWLMIAGLAAALVLDSRPAVVAVALVEAVVAAWFAWAMWVVTTPRFTDLPFPFIAPDVIGSGWYAAALGLLFAAGALVRELRRRDARLREDLWLLTALPGFGLMRIRRWLEGGIWAGLFIGSVYLASTGSPTATEFADYGRSGNVPPAYPRGAEWVLLGLAGVFWVVSIGVTAWRWRTLQTGPDSD
ncbi:MAG TPA: hypothetical protein VGE99_07090 [Candidatus Dormibacteraeota bacterium]